MKPAADSTHPQFETTADGQQVFYPWGLFGSGYIVPAGADTNPIRKLLSQRSSISYFTNPFAHSSGALAGLVLATLGLYLTWNQRRMLKLISGWTRIAPTKPNADDSIRAGLLEKPQFVESACWVALAISTLLMLGGIGFLFAVPSGEWLPYLAGIAGIAACATYCMRKLHSLHADDPRGE